MFLLLVIVFVIFTPKNRRKISTLFGGIVIYSIIFAIVGIPDVLLNKNSTASFLDFLSNNIIGGYNSLQEYMLPTHWFVYLLTNQYPILFGWALTLVTYVALIYWTYRFVTLGVRTSVRKQSVAVVLYISFWLFFLSLLPIRIASSGNRSLVLLPFIVMLSLLMVKEVYKKFQKRRLVFISFIMLLALCQIVQTLVVWSIKLYPDTRQTSSEWIIQHIPKNERIAIENVPLYEELPDITLKEAYNMLGKKHKVQRYQYDIIDVNTTVFPRYVVLTNEETAFVKSAPEFVLVQQLKRQGYKQIVYFYPRSFLFNVFSDRIGFAISGMVPVSFIDIYEKPPK